MGYPTGVVSWGNVAASGVVLRAEHLREPFLEIEAIEAEVGVDVHGTAGSLAERLSMAMDDLGNLIGRVAWANFADNQRRRWRFGYREFVTVTGGADSETFTNAIPFDPPFFNTPLVFFTMQKLVTTGSFPIHIVPGASVTVNGMDIIIQFRQGIKTISGVPFGVHWAAAEQAGDSTNVGL